MDRFTNGELDALLAAIEKMWDAATNRELERYREDLRGARAKLEAQRKAQQ